MRNMHRTLRIFVAVGLCLTLLMAPLVGKAGKAEEAEKAEAWSYANSLLVTLHTDAPRTFSPEDFAVISCKQVWVTEKAQDATGCQYELLLVLPQGGESALENSLAALRQQPGVLSAQRNEKYAKAESSLTLNASVLYLPVGAERELFIESLRLNEDNRQTIGVAFSMASPVDADRLQACGVDRFWPDTEQKENILLETPAELEGTVSPNGNYYGLASTDFAACVEAVNALSRLSEITAVSLVQKAIPGGAPPSESWTVEDDKVLQLQLSGGEIAPGLNENGPKLNQKATVQGQAPGVTRITVERTAPGAQAKDSCLVIVYRPGSRENPGDANGDGAVNAADALLALRHAVGAAPLPQAAAARTDLNSNGTVNAVDALIQLQIAVGKIQ